MDDDPIRAVTRRADEVRNTPAKARTLVSRALSGAISPRQAIKARCLQCCNYDRDEIRHCSAYGCVLHAYRPYQADEPDQPEESVEHELG